MAHEVDKNTIPVDAKSAFGAGWDLGYDDGYEAGVADGYDRGYAVALENLKTERESNP